MRVPHKSLAAAVLAVCTLTSAEARGFPLAGWVHRSLAVAQVVYPQWRPDVFGDTPAPRGAKKINEWVNSTIRYETDLSDHWQTPAETLVLKTGDCEDEAILKYSALKAQYVHSYLLLGTLSDGTGHATVLLDDGTQLHNSVQTDITPVVAFDDNGIWYKPQTP